MHDTHMAELPQATSDDWAAGSNITHRLDRQGSESAKATGCLVYIEIPV